MDNSQLDQLKSNPAALRIYQQRVKLHKEGNELVGSCPFHSEKTPSFTVFQKQGVWLYKCFGCQEAGNVLQFVQKTDSCNFNVAVKKVQEFIGDSWESNKQTVEETFNTVGENDGPTEYVTVPLSKWTATRTNALLKNTSALDWLIRDRGITRESAEKLHLGFIQSVGQLATGTTVTDKGWIGFPYIEGETVVCIKYRSIVEKKFARQPNMRTALFNTNTIDSLEDLYVVEGEFDATVLEQAGFHAVSIPSASTKITPEMKDLFLQANRVILAGDNDNSVGTALMEKLWAELQERTFLLKWPDGLKDANEVFMKKSFGNVKQFTALVNELTVEAASKPMPNVYSLPEAMLSGNRTNLLDHPLRMRFPWPSVDKMAILLPGSVMCISATQTKMAKTTWVMNATLEEAKRGQTVLNYQCELSKEEFANMVAAYVLRKDRNTLSVEDYKLAAKFIKNVKYYIGRNPTLTTVTPVLDLIEAAIRRLSPDVVVLDHLHFIVRNEPDTVKAEENAMQRIKNMAVKYGVKFIVVLQPRKSSQQNKGKLIHITDLKGSETVGSDADAIFVIHRDFIKTKDPNNPPMDDYDPKTEVHLLAARAKGPGSTFALLTFHGTYAAFWEETQQTPYGTKNSAFAGKPADVV